MWEAKRQMAVVTPVKRRARPGYPTIDEIGEAEFARVPARWARLKAVVASLGTVAMAMKAFTQEVMLVSGEEWLAAKKAMRRPTAAKTRTLERQAKSTAEVCPLLPVAVAGAGQGSFGCLSMYPPVFLSEAEALEIIEREFAKRGVKFMRRPRLDGVEVPSQLGKRQEVRLDLGTEQGDLMVEFISGDDVEYWKRAEVEPDTEDRWAGSGATYTISSDRVVDIRAAAESAVSALSKRTEGQPVTVGVLYDPMVFLTLQDIGWWRRLSAMQRDEMTRRDECRRRSKKLLVAQIEGLFKQLEARGKLPRKE